MWYNQAYVNATDVHTCIVKRMNEVDWEIVYDASKLTASDVTYNVSNKFTRLTIAFVANSVLMSVCAIFQVIATRFSKRMIVYSPTVSRINKFNLIAGGLMMLLLYFYRLNP